MTLTPTQIAILVAVAINGALTVLVAKLPNCPQWLKVLAGLLADIVPTLPGLPGTATHTAVTASKPVVGAQLGQAAKRGFLTLFVLVLALAPRPARAQVFSAGASLPMLEVQADKLHPVAFAPGLGVEGAVGFFQFAFMGHQYDALDLSAQLFGDAPGAFQVAALVGSLNNLVAVGVAVPLFAADGSGAFQGAFHAYPVLSLSIPISFGPTAPPTTTANGPLGLPRGATIYLP